MKDMTKTICMLLLVFFFIGGRVVFADWSVNGSGGDGDSTFTIGNVGIGRNAPPNKLWVDGGDETITINSDSGSPTLYLRNAVDSNFGMIKSNLGLELKTGTAQHLHILLNPGGNVGIGTTNPSSLLDLSSNSDTDVTLSQFSSDDTAQMINFVRARGTDSSPAAVQHSDGLGIIRWDVYDGNDYRRVAGVFVRTEGVSDNDVDTKMYFSLHDTDHVNPVVHSKLTLQSDGNVGIGINASPNKLWVHGGDETITINSDSGSPTLYLRNAVDSNIGRIKSNLGLELKSGEGQHHIILNPGGNVGIGTTNPQTKLAVDGTITAKEVNVTLEGWADYVLDDSYKLKPLDEVEEYIKTNKHLPDIPSEKQIRKDGLNMAEMMKLQMKKIEELTLYMIEIKKKADKLEMENTELKKEIKYLKAEK